MNTFDRLKKAVIPEEKEQKVLAVDCTKICNSSEMEGRAYCSRNSNNSVQTTLLKFKNFPTGESTLIVLVIVGTVVQKGSIFCNYSPRRESDRLMVLGLITGATTIEVRVASKVRVSQFSERRRKSNHHHYYTEGQCTQFPLTRFR